MASAWALYSDVETAMIEEAFQQKKKEVLLDDCCINLQDLVQISKSDLNNQGSVRHGSHEGREPVRQQRFMPVPSRPFLKRIDGWKPFLKAIKQHSCLLSRAFVLDEDFNRRMVRGVYCEKQIVESIELVKFYLEPVMV
jgi:hypothetical protein